MLVATPLVLVLAFALALAASESTASAFDDALVAGDRAWSERAASIEDDRARPERTIEAIGHYRAALDADPSELAAHWKLLRALHYAIDFTSLAEADQEQWARQAIEVAATASERAETGAGSDADRARAYFWSAIAWGTRAQRVGLITIVREGVATRMHDFAEQSLALDPGVDRGGAYRLLSRLHATLPRVPFVSGWVDRDKALPYAERGLAHDPEHPGNRLVLALALLEHAPDRAPEARALLEEVAAFEPRPEARAEDLRIREQANEKLGELSSPSR